MLYALHHSSARVVSLTCPDKNGLAGRISVRGINGCVALHRGCGGRFASLDVCKTRVVCRSLIHACQSVFGCALLVWSLSMLGRLHSDKISRGTTEYKSFTRWEFLGCDPKVRPFLVVKKSCDGFYNMLRSLVTKKYKSCEVGNS